MSMKPHVLKRLRKAAGLRQEDLARRSGLSLSSIAKYESGVVSNPGAEQLKAISAALSQELPMTVNQVLSALLSGEVPRSELERLEKRGLEVKG